MMDMQVKSQHEDWVDAWKGALMFLVVLGHVVGMLSHFASGSSKLWLEYVFKTIYCFHMPAFFGVAGYTWKRSANQNFKAFFAKRFGRLVVPYLVFSVVSAVIYYFASVHFQPLVSAATDEFYDSKGGSSPLVSLLLSIVHAGGWPANGVFVANSVLWFLPAMFTVQLLYWIFDRFIPQWQWQVVLSLLLLLASHYMPARLPWGMSKGLYYIPFVVTGRWLIPLSVKMKSIGRRGAAFLIGMLLYLALCWIMPNAFHAALWLRWRFAFAALAVLGMVLSATCARMLPSRLLVCLGASTLGIMLLHKYLVLAFCLKLPFIRDLCVSGPMTLSFLSILITIVSLMLAWGASVVLARFAPFALGVPRRRN